MTRKLEETFDLRPIKEAADTESTEKEEAHHEDPEARAANIISALSTAEKVDHSLSVVTGISDHDSEMDEIASEALASYLELKELGAEQSDAHAARMMEVASTMLKTALEARDAKVTRKLKTLDLQLKRLKLEQDAKKNQKAAEDSPSEEGMEFDRDHLLSKLRGMLDSDRE